MYERNRLKDAKEYDSMGAPSVGEIGRVVDVLFEELHKTLNDEVRQTCFVNVKDGGSRVRLETMNAPLRVDGSTSPPMNNLLNPFRNWLLLLMGQLVDARETETLLTLRR